MAHLSRLAQEVLAMAQNQHAEPKRTNIQLPFFVKGAMSDPVETVAWCWPGLSVNNLMMTMRPITYDDWDYILSTLSSPMTIGIVYFERTVKPNDDWDYIF